MDGCRSLTDNYKYSISQGVIQCCKCLGLWAKGWTWEVLASPAPIDPVSYYIKHVTPDASPLSVGWALRTVEVKVWRGPRESPNWASCQDVLS